MRLNQLFAHTGCNLPDWRDGINCEQNGGRGGSRLKGDSVCRSAVGCYLKYWGDLSDSAGELVVSFRGGMGVLLQMVEMNWGRLRSGFIDWGVFCFFTVGQANRWRPMEGVGELNMDCIVELGPPVACGNLGLHPRPPGVEV
jgi:hypothetical protein